MSKNTLSSNKMHYPPEVCIVSSFNDLEMNESKVKLPQSLTKYFNDKGVFLFKSNYDKVISNSYRTWYPPYDGHMFLLKKPLDDKLPQYKNYKFVYHGTSLATIIDIMDDTPPNLKKMPPVKGHATTDCLWVSPSALYSSHPSYAQPETIDGHKYRFVLQLLIPNGWAETGQGGEYRITVPVANPAINNNELRLEPRIYNDQLAWWTRTELDNHVYGLVVYRGSGFPFTNGIDEQFENVEVTGTNIFFPNVGVRIVYVIGSGTTTNQSWKGVEIYRKFNCTVVASLTEEDIKKSDIKLVIASSSGASRIPPMIKCNLLLLSPVYIPNCAGKRKIVFAENDPITKTAREYCVNNKIKFDTYDDHHQLPYYSKNHFLADVQELTQ